MEEVQSEDLEARRGRLPWIGAGVVDNTWGREKTSENPSWWRK